MEKYLIPICIATGVLFVIILISLVSRQKGAGKRDDFRQVKGESLDILADYVRTQKEQAETQERLKELKKAELKQKLEVYKQTKDQLKGRLRVQLDRKEWRSLKSILNSADKGGMGIYIVYNQTKNKYYVGQAKQIFKRVRDHFSVETMALDFLSGDDMCVKFLTANELDDDYRLDHIEKTAIEIYQSDKQGYNKTTGNL